MTYTIDPDIAQKIDQEWAVATKVCDRLFEFHKKAKQTRNDNELMATYSKRFDPESTAIITSLERISLTAESSLRHNKLLLLSNLGSLGTALQMTYRMYLMLPVCHHDDRVMDLITELKSIFQSIGPR